MNQLSDNRQSITYRARTALDALRKELLDQRTDRLQLGQLGMMAKHWQVHHSSRHTSKQRSMHTNMF